MKLREFSTPANLLPTKLQFLKILILSSHELQGHMSSETLIGHDLGNSKRYFNRAKRSECSNPVGLLSTKLQVLKISIWGHMTSETKLDFISETVRAQRSKFSNLWVN